MTTGKASKKQSKGKPRKPAGTGTAPGTRKMAPPGHAIQSSSPWLLPGEEVDFKEDEEDRTATDEELNRRYVTGEVRIVTESARYSLAQILAMLEERVGAGAEKRLRYDLDPEYQRRHRWSEERKSRLIESFLMNIPVPPIFLYERDYAQFEVMDGRQRLTALAEFYRNDFPLEGLEHWKELNGRTYDKLPTRVRDGIDRRYISSIILLKETARDEEQAAQLKKLVFQRLNTGGVELSHQEARNAVYQGKLNRLCLDLSKNKDFRRMWQIPDEPEPQIEETDDNLLPSEKISPGEKMFQRMDDVELVLRFFAYRLLSQHSNMGLNKVSMFLDRFLAQGNHFPESVLAEYRKIFEATTSLLWETLGESAFCPRLGRRRLQERPTKIVYDPLMWVASRYAVGDKREALLRNPEILLEGLGAMYENHGDSFAGRRTNANHVRERNHLMEGAFREIIAKLDA
jgi:Protein of unknown function DUF262